MYGLRVIAVLFVLFSVISCVFVLDIEAWDVEDVAVSAISHAEEVLASAYEAALEAEGAGANVSGLLVRLNDAGEHLAKAHIAYRLGDFDQAGSFANLCSEIGEDVKSEADGLRGAGFESRVTGFWLTIAGSLVGVVAAGLGGVWGWRVFKRRYYQRVLGMKPEVASDDS